MPTHQKTSDQTTTPSHRPSHRMGLVLSNPCPVHDAEPGDGCHWVFTSQGKKPTACGVRIRTAYPPLCLPAPIVTEPPSITPRRRRPVLPMRRTDDPIETNEGGTGYVGERYPVRALGERPVRPGVDNTPGPLSGHAQSGKGSKTANSTKGTKAGAR